MIERIYSQRGFVTHGKPVITRYGHKLEVSQSSNADYHGCWLEIANEDEGEAYSVNMNEEQVVALVARLVDWLSLIKGN